MLLSYKHVYWLTKSSEVPSLSSSMDCMREMWTPISRWMPEHSMQVRIPRLVDNHFGSINTDHMRKRWWCVHNLLQSKSIKLLQVLISVAPGNNRQIHITKTQLDSSSSLFTPAHLLFNWKNGAKFHFINSAVKMSVLCYVPAPLRPPSMKTSASLDLIYVCMTEEKRWAQRTLLFETLTSSTAR